MTMILSNPRRSLMAMLTMLLSFMVTSSVGFVDGFTTTMSTKRVAASTKTILAASIDEKETAAATVASRRQWLQSATTTAAAIATMAGTIVQPLPAIAASDNEKPSKPSVSLEDALYLILRVREATQQETRLITTGKFKDVQRANVKLAVGMIVKNYRLSDNINIAAAYLPASASMKAISSGQAAVQSLQTILEYFDTSDVQNLKVNEASMSGEKQTLVLKGLDSAKNNLDIFVSYFPESKILEIKEKITNENELNRKEFDPSLGDILNLPK